LFKDDEFLKAKGLADDTIRRYPERYAIWQLRGQCSYEYAMETKLSFEERRGWLEASLADFCRAVILNETAVLAFLYRGNTLVELGRFEEALTSFDKALRVFDESKEWLDEIKCMILAAKGRALVKSGRWLEASSCYEGVLEIDPEHRDTLRQLAAVYTVLREVGG
jgi:tetratricopeptide (TPR) repeat protein